MGKVLRFRRPKHYEQCIKVEGTRPVPQLDLKKLGNVFVSTKVEDGPNKVDIIFQLLYKLK